MVPRSEPFHRELLILAGKGGVGKTTIASVVALHLARRGRRTLLVTIDPAQRLKDALGVPVGHRIRRIQENLYAMMLDPERILEEYLRETMPDRDLTQHPLYKYISNYMPGVNELLAIGNLIEIRREKAFDSVVIDTAPTGHALSFLTTPMKVRDLLRENVFLKWALRGYGLYQRVSKGSRRLQRLFGGKDAMPKLPELDLEALFAQLSEQVGEIHDLLQDPTRTSLSLVTVPEKLAVQETLELHAYITATLKIRVDYLILNKTTPDWLATQAPEFDRFSRDENAQALMREELKRLSYPERLLQAFLHATRFEHRRHEMNLTHTEFLRKRLPQVPLIPVPLQPEDVHGLNRLQELETLFFTHLETASGAPKVPA